MNTERQSQNRTRLRRFQSYPAYKDSTVEWLGEIPAHWAVLAIKRVTSIPVTDGPHETPELLYEGIPFISAEAIKNDKIDFGKKRGFISAEDHARFSRKYKPQRADIFLIKSGATTGNVAFVDTEDEFNIWSPLAAIRPNHKKAQTAFVFFFMKSKEFFQSIELGWSYGTQQNIGMNVIENIPIALPPVLEQRAISAFLDRETARTDALLAKKARLIELLQERRNALITHVVTKGLDPNVPMKDSGVKWLGKIPAHWKVLRLKLLFEDIYRYPTYFDIEYVPDGIPEVRGEALVDGSITILPDQRYITAETNRRFARTILQEGDLVMSVRGTMGKIGLVQQEFAGANITANLLKLSPRKDIATGHYLSWLLRSEFFLKSLDKQSPQTTIQTITMPQLTTIVLPIPGLGEQITNTSFLDRETARIDTLVAKVREAIDRLKEYRTALISAAVTGKIDVREEVA